MIVLHFSAWFGMTDLLLQSQSHTNTQHSQKLFFLVFIKYPHQKMFEMKVVDLNHILILLYTVNSHHMRI
jgi:hypothetical protein